MLDGGTVGRQHFLVLGVGDERFVLLERLVDLLPARGHLLLGSLHTRRIGGGHVLPHVQSHTDEIGVQLLQSDETWDRIVVGVIRRTVDRSDVAQEDCGNQ